MHAYAQVDVALTPREVHRREPGYGTPLWVVDDGPDDGGQFGGWSVTITARVLR